MNIIGFGKQIFQSASSYIGSFFGPTAEQKQTAAKKVQKAFRGWRCRKALAERKNSIFLSKRVRTQVDDYLSKLSPGAKTNIPKATAGNTPVYFPNELPDIILKCSGSYSYSRLHQMIVAQDICKEMHATGLVIPKVLFKENMLVEERLPLGTSIERFQQQKLYVEHLKEATQVVRALTHFLLRTGIRDLTTNYPSFPHEFSMKPRYDNFPFFITDKNEIKIGLIDLEQMQIRSKPNLNILGQLLYVYPYHVDDILEIASSYFSEDEIAQVKNKAEEGRRFIETAYVKLQQHLEKKRTKEVVLDSKIRLQIIEELKVQENLSSDECQEISKALTAIVEDINLIKTSDETKAPYYRFEQGCFFKKHWSSAGFHILHSRLLDARSKLYDVFSDGITQYLIRKLVEHGVIYGYTYHGELID